MLDAKSLEVLNSLKSDIKSQKTVLKGHIKGTGKSFGFVVSEDDGKEYFLAPDEMKKVFPGDQVTFTVSEQDDGKSKAELESLVNSSLKDFNGVFYVRGKAQGVEPFDEQFNGWLFIPPKQAGDAEHNHIVKAVVTRHPWETGKAQAKITNCLGSADNNRAWYSMTLAQYGIPEEFSSKELDTATEIKSNGINIPEHYSDFTNIPFVTIDSATTRDMDDALYAEETEEGWRLSVAIADASLFIEPDSVLDAAANKRLTTTYLPGLTLPMLPEALSEELISLVPEQVRPAVVFQLTVKPNGEISEFNLTLASIISQAKLSYADVSSWIETDTFPDEHTSLKTLYAACHALGEYRKSKTAVMKNRIDYRIRVNDEFQVTQIEIEQNNLARDLVEEAMLATNSQVANWLKQDKALFMAHAGFKPDRESELKGLLRDYCPSVANSDSSKLEEFTSILKAAASVQDFPLMKVLQKRFDRGYWSQTRSEHFGLGFEQYTTATSPIRKYADLTIHRLLKSKIVNQDNVIDANVADDFNSRGNQSRNAAQSIENRLRLNWLASQDNKVWVGTIVHINSNGIVVQLNENGATGLIDLRKQKDKFTYDPLRMLLKSEQMQYQLEDQVNVSISQVNSDQLTLSLS